jgi:hypothetical protein
MDIDYDKIDECTLALLYLVTFNDHDVPRAWKSFDWDTMNRLYEKGFIRDPKSKSKSVVVTPEGKSKAKELFERLFAQ